MEGLVGWTTCISQDISGGRQRHKKRGLVTEPTQSGNVRGRKHRRMQRLGGYRFTAATIFVSNMCCVGIVM
jgi:hypothetical protein